MWLSSWRAPSGETLIFVPPVTEGRRVIVVFMGPTGDADVADDQQAQPGAEEDDGDQADGAGPGVRLGDELGRGGGRPAGAVAAGEGARGLADGFHRRAFGTAAGTRAIGPVCPSAGGYAGPLALTSAGSCPTMGLCWR